MSGELDPALRYFRGGVPVQGRDGKVDTAKLKPVARLGYMDYCLVEEVFTMPRPAWPKKSSDAAD